MDDFDRLKQQKDDILAKKQGPFYCFDANAGGFVNATERHLRAAGYVPAAERDALVAQVATMRGALGTIAKQAKTTPTQLGGFGFPDWVGNSLRVGEIAEAALAFTPTAAEQRVRALEDLYQTICAIEGQFVSPAVIRQIETAAMRVRALDGKDGAEMAGDERIRIDDPALALATDAVIEAARGILRRLTRADGRDAYIVSGPDMVALKASLRALDGGAADA